MPLIIDNPGQSVVDYIRYIDKNVTFARQLIAWTVEDRREAHRERVNEKRNLITYKPGDIVMERIVVNSKSDEERVQKLVYQSRGPYVVINDTSNGAYEVRRFGKPNGALHKFLTDDLYLLPKQLLPCEHLDTPDMRYLNSDFAPVNHPFGNFDLESYNTAWFDDEPPSRVPEFLYDTHLPDTMLRVSHETPHNTVAPQDTQPPDEIPPHHVSESATTADIENDIVFTTNPSLFSDLASSTDKLLFINFTPSHTMRPR